MSKPFVPRAPQIPMINHLVKHKRCALWADMGLGKSAAVIAALERLNFIQDVYPALVIGPLRVARDTWPEETPKWDQFKHIEISAIVGELHERMAALNKKTKIYSLNVEQIPWLVGLYGNKWPFKSIIFDESTRLAGFRIRQGAQRSRELYKVAWLPNVNIFWELTGAPVPNGLKSLHGQIHFLDQGERLGRSYTSFEQRWFQRGFDGFSLKPLPHAQAEIEEKLKDICLSVLAEDYFDLKEPIRHTVFVNLPPAARRIYNEMEKQMFTTIKEQGVEAFGAAAKRIKAMQIADGILLTDEKGSWEEVHNEKIKALESIVEESNGATMLVAYHFRADAIRLEKAFKGSVNLSTKEGMKKFKDGKAQIGLAHPASLGHGIDGLQNVTNRLVYFSHNDNLDNHKQILGRIGPMRQMQAGFDRPVFVYHIVAKNTVEEYAVLPNLQGKGEMQDLLMKAMRSRT